MIKIIGQIPKSEFGVACSGGVDSMAVLTFLLNGGYKPHVLYFNHNTEHAFIAEDFLTDYCNSNNLNLIIGRTDVIPKSNCEKIWRDERYKFFFSFNFPIITCHHLDDCVETYIYSFLKGNKNHIIPYNNKNVIRPFLLNEKSVFINWCHNKNIKYVIDESNYNLMFSRNRIRHMIIPECLKINPGLKKIIRKLILNEMNKQCHTTN